MRTASIPLLAYAEAPKGSRHYRACEKALELNPDVICIGEVYGERYYRVCRNGGDPHVVRRWRDEYGDEQIECNCEASVIPQEPTPCLHSGAVLLLENGLVEER